MSPALLEETNAVTLPRVASLPEESRGRFISARRLIFTSSFPKWKETLIFSRIQHYWTCKSCLQFSPEQNWERVPRCSAEECFRCPSGAIQLSLYDALSLQWFKGFKLICRPFSQAKIMPLVQQHFLKGSTVFLSIQILLLTYVCRKSQSFSICRSINKKEGTVVLSFASWHVISMLCPARPHCITQSKH